MQRSYFFKQNATIKASAIKEDESRNANCKNVVIFIINKNTSL